ncbi:hypothetical protein TNCV_4209731 [Trichonephila clavipes]|nr:hypothetical protein TNCV_4209731 [Trichonephila clavipes]
MSWQSTAMDIMPTWAIDDNVCTASIMRGKVILEYVHDSKNFINADFNDENEMNNAAPVPTSSKKRNVIKSQSSYLDAHSNDEMNKKFVISNNLLTV